MRGNDNVSRTANCCPAFFMPTERGPPLSQKEVAHLFMPHDTSKSIFRRKYPYEEVYEQCHQPFHVRRPFR